SQSPPSEFLPPDKVHSPTPRRGIAPSERAAETPAHQYRWRVRPAAERWERLRSQCDSRETPWRQSGISDIHPPALRSIRRQSLPNRVPQVRRKSESLRSESANLSAVAPECRRWYRETRRCWPCRLFSQTWCSRRHAKTSHAQFRAAFFSRSPARAI